MPKTTSKKRQTLHLTVLYSVMTLAVIILVSALVLVVSNYGFDSQTGTLQQRGLVQFNSIPSGATVEIDDKTISSKTATKHSVKPGEHRFVMWREGYHSWIKSTDVKAGNLRWLNYARLVPKDLPVQTIAYYSDVSSSLAAPNKESILLQIDKTKPQFRLINIARQEPLGENIQIPATILSGFTAIGNATDQPIETDVAQPEHHFTPRLWDDSSRFVLIEHSFGDQKEAIVLNTRQPEKSVNLTREFSLPLNNLRFSGRSGNLLYALSNGSLRKLDVAGGTLSRSLAEDLQSFELYDENALSFVTKVNDDDQQSVGFYREGDSDPTILKTLKASSDNALSIAIHEYYSSFYVAIGARDKLMIYKGNPENGLSNMQKVTSKTVDQARIKSLEFNESGSYILVRAGQIYASYGIEQQDFAQNKLSDAQSQDFLWLDAMNLALIANNQLTMRELDGANQFTINQAQAGQAVTLSKNGTYLYSIGSDKNGQKTLQRVRMILP